MALFVTVNNFSVANAQESGKTDTVPVSKLTLDTPSTVFTESIKPYIKKKGEVLHFDIEQARFDGATQDVLEVGNLFNQYSVAATDKESRLGFPAWGNWCGPGHSGPGKPTDLLDTACMHHDQCYGDPVTPQCTCDQKLIDEINSKYSRMRKPEKAMANVIVAYFKAQKLWCNPN